LQARGAELPLAALAVVFAFQEIRAGVAGRNEVVTKLKSGNGRERARCSRQRFRGLEECFSKLRLSGVVKRFRQFGCAEHICDALEVICHRCEADFGLCT
jgi:hypothetical protein